LYGFYQIFYFYFYEIKKLLSNNSLRFRYWKPIPNGHNALSQKRWKDIKKNLSKEIDSRIKLFVQRRKQNWQHKCKKEAVFGLFGCCGLHDWRIYWWLDVWKPCNYVRCSTYVFRLFFLKNLTFIIKRCVQFVPLIKQNKTQVIDMKQHTHHNGSL